MAKFPRLRNLRQDLGWEITVLAAKLDASKPGISSLYRLEQGYAIRLVSARKVFDVINAGMGGVLDPKVELVEAPL